MNKLHPRDIFQQRIEKGLLGPGSDIFVAEEDKNEEIISSYPLQRYYTGILFPEQTKIKTLSEKDENELAKSIDDGTQSEDVEQSEELPEEMESNIKNGKPKAGDDEVRFSQNNFFPTNMGLTFCIDNQVEELDVTFNFGLYKPIEKGIKIKVDKSVFDLFINHSTFPFKSIIRYENGYMILGRKLKGSSMFPLTEEHEQFDNFKDSDECRNSSLSPKMHFFEKLIRRTWKREYKSIPKTIKIEDTEKPIPIDDKASYTLKTYTVDKQSNTTYVKVLLANTSPEHPSNQFSNIKKTFNQKCLFQANIQVKIPELKPYKSYLELNPLDEEAEVLNYLYKNKFSYGIGHNCSVKWDKTDNIIQTTFLPEYDVKDTKNSFKEEDFRNNPKGFKVLNDSLDIYNLSHFSTNSKTEIIERLQQFIKLYGEWINEQKQQSSTNERIEKSIFKNLDYNRNRLQVNIKRLENDNIFRAFQLTNTAMLIQIIISNDEDFAGKEKEMSELNENIEYSNINFFQNYDFSKLGFGRPQYRPFQLAFLLLNLDSISDLESDARNKIVDLIWFPTGGGKTEAYLAVAAFTIIYRRLMNETGYEGTSVIMRYTLRLLTAQQFERASRLIVTLEFLRKHFEEYLKSTPITIGMWVGKQSTPNTIKEAKGYVDDIAKICNEDKNPTNKNKFQISSCSWCGCKLMTQNHHNKWTSGFEYNKSKKFRIKCVNEKCHYHNELPIQVVDDMLYEHPPTLLFGTVDKFAMLAWQEKGHGFFNSQNEKLPPDLIIQDELHLLSGPLGSITGIFESVIEMLCTKGGHRPKIISSTATTRNTSEQIKALYGDSRNVNVFPPSGLTYENSFFAKTAINESKRRYIGFMPTGKATINTQLQIIAHLFVARLEAYRTLIQNNKKDYNLFDKYWTLVSYYNSLKDVGKIHNKVGDEISAMTKALQKKLFGTNPNYTFNYSGIYNRDEELTSRVSSSKIKQTLKRLEENTFTEETRQKSDNGNTYVKFGIIDLVLATNMISVGIDIERFNIMLINGQPRNIAEYIQASSRVGRRYKGLVIGLLDANRARDKSHFEHFVPFHQAFYKSVEPISLTPFTENTLEKMLTSVVITYIRHKYNGETSMTSNNSAGNFKPEMLDDLREEIKQRFVESPNVYQVFENKVEKIIDEWLYKIENHNLKKYYDSKGFCLLKKPNKIPQDEKDQWAVMQSMREIDTNSLIKIELPKIWDNG